ncbi:glycoside hydrolase family 5 protein [Patellaria atrata CBS 101060]|uniref:glucan 1,3-beta-glucosidase n=1 Tax=Patellaria atrata CBS 101060 TaxID=1346257 RepID=A0A9P4VMQ4_9PEZI|nr:glycoside hydrolase family 5 protein [Patellaria atrata CBS 101060]
MVPEVFEGTEASDQWQFDQTPGATQALDEHWSTYFTEDDVRLLVSHGINAIRIPIGYWAYNNSGTPYIQGADVYLEQAISWSRTAGIKVIVDLHGAPGSQNGFDNSGQQGAVEWQHLSNLVRTSVILQEIATKYGSLDYADVVVGVEMVNEPISWGANQFNITKQWATDIFPALKDAAENKDLQIIAQDAFMGSRNWLDVSAILNPNFSSVGTAGFAVDSHYYQVFVEEDNQLTQEGHILKACGWGNDLLPARIDGLPVYVGEWSSATNICIHANGTVIPGFTCDAVGCQCQSSTPIEQWNELMVEQVRKYVEAQMDVWEQYTSGYFFWSYKGPGGWGFLSGTEKGTIPSPVTSRLYRPQCVLR